MSFSSTPDFRRWGFVDASDARSASELAALERQLLSFYERQAAQQRYWLDADAFNSAWQPDSHAFHVHLAGLIKSGECVVDFGCGSAHPVRNLPSGIDYLGIDGSLAQVEANRKIFPEQRFLHANMIEDNGLDASADWAVSFFAIEHCPHPDRLLRRMLRTCKPGGRIAVLCPNFRGGMNSLRSGFSALVNRDKLKRLRFADLLVGYVEDRWLWPTRIRAIHESDMAFPIYLRPRCLNAPFFVDSDAVYLTSERKMARFLEAEGCTIELTSKDVPASNDLRGAVIYLVARTPLG